jgi:hypothetical protein
VDERDAGMRKRGEWAQYGVRPRSLARIKIQVNITWSRVADSFRLLPNLVQRFTGHTTAEPQALCVLAQGASYPEEGTRDSWCRARSDHSHCFCFTLAVACLA